jgi:hypothetical protein
MVAEQGSNIEFRTVYETKTKTLRVGEEPPIGGKRIPAKSPVGGVGGAGDVPVYPDGQNPETGEAGEGERKAYRT